jgi:hypothetical protein
MRHSTYSYWIQVDPPSTYASRARTVGSPALSGAPRRIQQADLTTNPGHSRCFPRPFYWIRSKMLKGLGRNQNLWMHHGRPRKPMPDYPPFGSNATPSSCEKLEPSRHQSDLLIFSVFLNFSMVIFGVLCDFRIHSIMSLLEQMFLRLFEKI